MSAIELTHNQAVEYLHDLGDVLNGLSVALAAAGRIATRQPALSVPEGMLCSLVSSWESCDSRFQEVYAQAYGHEAATDDEAFSARTQEDLGTAELQ